MPWLYIMTNRPRGTLYIGATDDLVRRFREHRGGRGSGFTKRHGLTRLVWYEEVESGAEAAQREKTMKEWPREWKLNLIERQNLHWHDLGPALTNKVMRDPGNEPRG